MPKTHTDLSLVQSSRLPAKRSKRSDAAATETVDLSLRLLEHLSQSGDPLGISDLAREFESSKATVYRHIRALERHGFVRQDPATLRYAPGIKIFLLGERLRERFDVLAVAREEMSRLRDETAHAVTLATLVEDQVIVLELLHGPAIVDFGTRPGTVLDLHASAHGKVALAFGPQGLLERCLAKPLKAWTPHTICSHTAIRRVVSQVRSDGWATAPNQVLPGVNGLAAPVLDHRGIYAGGIAIAGSIQSIPGAPSGEQIASVTAAAERISRKLGWRAGEDQRAMANKRKRR